MAFTEEFWGHINTHGDTTTYKLSILEDGFAGSTTQWTTPAKPSFTLKNRVSKKDEATTIIYSTELEATFILTPGDGSTFDALFDPTERQFRGDLYKDGVLYYQGWLKGENIRKNFIGANFEVTLSFSDSLNELKDYDFAQSSGQFYKDTQSELSVLKNALTNTGLTLPFKVQLGWYESVQMTSTQCVLEQASLDTERFIGEKEGLSVVKNCYEVIELVLKKYNCKIQQDNGYYLISQKLEYNSYIFEYDWATLTLASRTAHDASLDINNYQFLDKGTKEKLKPLKRVEVTQRNASNGTNLIVNGTFDANVNNWTNSGFYTFTWDSSGRAKAFEITGFDKNSITSDAMSISVGGENDYLKVFLEAEFQTTETNQSNFPVFTISLQFPDLSELVLYSDRIKEGIAKYESIVLPTINQTGDYKLILYVDAPSSYTNPVTVYFDDIEMVRYSENSESYVYDYLLNIYNSGAGGSRVQKVENLFGDGLDSAELSAIKIGGNLTASWRTYGGTEDVTLAELLGTNILIGAQSARDYLRVKILDSLDVIDPSTVLLFQSKYYRFTNFAKDLYFKAIEGELSEIQTASISTSTGKSILNTANGVDVGTPTQTVYSSNSLVGLLNIVEDTTPQLGGNLDLNGNSITGTGGINITGDIQATTLKVDSTRGLTAVTGSFGTVQTTGSGIGSYGGYNIDGKAVFMSNGSAAGLYDDANNKWFFVAYPLAGASVYYNGSVKLATTNTGISVTGDADLSGHVLLDDSKAVKFGTGADWTMYSTGTNLYIDQERNIADVFYIRDVLNAIKFKFDLNTGNFSCAGEIEGFATL